MRPVAILTAALIIVAMSCWTVGYFHATFVAAPAAGGVVGSGSAAPAGRDKDIDEAKVKLLIEQMGSRKWKTRQAAYEKLKAMGPKIIPLLMKYRDHEDLEIASRVGAIIDEHIWATTGTLVVKVHPDSQALRLGIRAGDVLLKIGNVDITNSRDLRKVDSRPNRTYYLCRDKKVIPFEAGPGLIGITVVNWNGTDDDKNRLIGLAAIRDKRYEDAYTWLDKALNEGMNDPAGLLSMAALAEFHLDHKRAMRLHQRYLKAVKSNSADSADARPYGPLPDGLLGSVHTAYLLERMKNEQAGPELRSRLEGWFLAGGRNYPLARKILNREWPDRSDAGHKSQSWLNHVNGTMAVKLHQRKWAEVLSLYADNPGARAAYLAMCAALEIGDVDKAFELGMTLLDDCRESEINPRNSACVYALAAAYMAGRDDLVENFWLCVKTLSRPKLAQVFSEGNIEIFRSRFLAPKVLPVLDAMDGGVGDLRRGRDVLKQVVEGQDTTGENWKDGKRHSKGHSYRAAWELLQGHTDRLQTDWAVLKSGLSGSPGFEKGSFWIIRCDSKAFFVDTKGVIHQYEGLAGIDPLNMYGIGYVAHSNAGITLNLISNLYLLDESQQRWVPTYTVLRMSFAGWKYSNPAAAMVKYAMKQYPVAGSGREVLWSEDGAKGWRWFVLNGDIGIVVLREKDEYTVHDLSVEIAALAGRKERVAVYRPCMAGEKLLIPTDCGLWIMDVAGNLIRANLALKNPDVMTVVMDWPARKGKAYVGVVPQQGGQVFELDIETSKFTLTGGYCGLGPDDSFAAANALRNRPSLYALQAIYEKRLSASSTAPASGSEATTTTAAAEK